MRGVDKGVVQLSGFLCKFVDVPGELLPLGSLLFGICQRTIGKQEGGYLLSHIAQLLPERLPGVLGFEFELPLLVRQLSKASFLGFQFCPERGQF